MGIEGSWRCQGEQRLEGRCPAHSRPPSASRCSRSGPAGTHTCLPARRPSMMPHSLVRRRELCRSARSPSLPALAARRRRPRAWRRRFTLRAAWVLLGFEREKRIDNASPAGIIAVVRSSSSPVDCVHTAFWLNALPLSGSIWKLALLGCVLPVKPDRSS
eukprot:278698-Rhodomonas_salina.1